MSNREKRTYTDHLHLYLAFKRPKYNESADCLRTVIHGHDKELESFEAKLKILGGHWRIHRTVNARDVEKARIWLIKHLLDTPANACFVDSAWRTALLQPECIYGKKKFMLDIDTNEPEDLANINYAIQKDFGEVLETYKTPNGWHYITKPFDTRNTCALPWVTLIRDGYYYIKTVGGENAGNKV